MAPIAAGDICGFSCCVGNQKWKDFLIHRTTMYPALAALSGALSVDQPKVFGIVRR